MAMSPEAAYIIDNLGLAVGTVAWHPDTGAVTGHDMVDIENKLQSREFAGMVCNITSRSVGSGGSISSRDAEVGQGKFDELVAEAMDQFANMFATSPA